MVLSVAYVPCAWMGGVVSNLSDPAFFIDLREQRTLALADLGELLGSIELSERDEPLHIGRPRARNGHRASAGSRA